jgi:hypothetical protein
MIWTSSRNDATGVLIGNRSHALISGPLAQWPYDMHLLYAKATYFMAACIKLSIPCQASSAYSLYYIYANFCAALSSFGKKHLSGKLALQIF